MSDSPVRRFSTASPTNQLKREETLINAYEAEEERIINVLSRKLEQVRSFFFRWEFVRSFVRSFYVILYCLFFFFVFLPPLLSLLSLRKRF